MNSKTAIVPPVIILAFLVAACSSSPPAEKEVVVVKAPETTKSTKKAKTGVYGPPPHAPAHGYRHRHAPGVELVFDAELEVYVVSGTAGRYWWKGSFYRKRGNAWQLSRTLDGPWKKAGEDAIPPGLGRATRGPRSTVN